MRSGPDPLEKARRRSTAMDTSFCQRQFHGPTLSEGQTIPVCFTNLTAASLYDIHTRRIPNYLTVSAYAIILIHDLIFSLSKIPLHLACSIFFLTVFLIAKIITGGLGYGDIKLAAFTGYSMGFIRTSAIFFASSII